MTLPDRIQFSKIEGIGNDFIVIDCRNAGHVTDRALSCQLGTSLYPPHLDIPALCDRRTGIGANGVVFIHDSATDADAKMVIFNSDNSRPEICGNGLRCVVLHLFSLSTPQGSPKRRQASQLTVETDAGPLCCIIEPKTEALRSDDTQRCNNSLPAQAAKVSIEMPAAHVIPPPPGYEEKRSIEHGGCSVTVQCQNSGDGDRVFSGTLVNIGNPHFIYFTTEADNISSYADLIRFAKIWGPLIESHHAFPKRINVSFVRSEWLASDNVRRTTRSIDAVVYERGAGLTEACGSGACAIAAASHNSHIQRGHEIDAVADNPREWNIRLPGGLLTITTMPRVQQTNTPVRGNADTVTPAFIIKMTGPARYAYQGSFLRSMYATPQKLTDGPQDHG